MGYDFHRQKPLDNYIADFFCHELMLAIEIDGYTHLLEEVQDKDEKKEKKEKRLNGLGIHVLRFQDSEVFKDIENVLRVIEIYILEYERTPPASFSFYIFGKTHPHHRYFLRTPSQEGE